MLVCAGVLTSDPRIVRGARPVPLLTYEEATELAFFGAAVLHPLAMQPAIQSDSLSVRVKNSFNRCAFVVLSAWHLAGQPVLGRQPRSLSCPCNFAAGVSSCRQATSHTWPVNVADRFVNATGWQRGRS